MSKLLIDSIGWLGAICIALNGIPQLWKTFKVKNVQGLSFWMLFLWFNGCICLLTYTILSTPTLVLIMNYTWSGLVSFLLICFFLRYK